MPGLVSRTRRSHLNDAPSRVNRGSWRPMHSPPLSRPTAQDKPPARGSPSSSLSVDRPGRAVSSPSTGEPVGGHRKGPCVTPTCGVAGWMQRATSPAPGSAGRGAQGSTEARRPKSSSTRPRSSFPPDATARIGARIRLEETKSGSAPSRAWRDRPRGPARRGSASRFGASAGGCHGRIQSELEARCLMPTLTARFGHRLV